MKTRLFVNKLHFYLALIATVPIVILCITGSILVYKEAIDEYFTRPYTHVEARPTKILVSEMLTRLKAEVPGRDYAGVVFPIEEGRSYFFWMKDSDFWTVAYIDPYTGAFKGVRDWYDWSWANTIWWVTDLHYSFKWGRVGSYFVAASSGILLFSILSGLYLWWPRRSKFDRSKFTLRRGRRWKQTAFNLHGVLGFYVSSVLIVVILTGISITFYEPFNRLMHAVTFAELHKDPQARVPDPTKPYLSTEEVVAIAKTHLKETFGMSPDVQSMAFPTEENIVVELGFQGKAEYAGAAHTHVFVDTQTGEVVDVETQANMSGAGRFVSWMSPIHYGTWGEVLGETGDWYSRVVWFVAALMPIFLMVSGFSIVKKSRWKGIWGRKSTIR